MKLLKSKDDISRLTEIVNVLIKYGFDNSITNDLKSKIKIFNKVLPETQNYDVNTRIRLVLEELGTTFIKLGQTLSTFPNIVGVELAEELSKLQQSAPVSDYEDVKDVIESEFSKPIDEVFSDFSEKPIASASIGQIHKAFYKDNLVAVKVQHPNIQQTIESDIRIMKTISKYTNKLSSLAIFNFPELIDVFERDMKNELDYTFEAINTIHMDDLLRDDEVHIPKIYSDVSTSKILTMEFIDGVSLSEVFEASDDEYDKKKIAHVGADSYIKQILIHGFYHADPHPGNIFVINRDIVTFIDFGMIGHLSNSLRKDLIKLFTFIIQNDAYLLTKQLYRMNIVKNKKYFESIENEIIYLLDKNYNAQFNDITGIFQEVIKSKTLQQYGVVIPRELMMVIRTISMVYDFGCKLDDEFDTTEVLRPYALKLFLDNFSGSNKYHKSRKFSMNLEYLMHELPDALIKFLNIVDDDGKVRLSLESNELDSINNIVSRIINEIVLSIIIAALLIGSSVMVHSGVGMKLFGYPILGFVGFSFSGILGIILVIMILRRGNY